MGRDMHPRARRNVVNMYIRHDRQLLLADTSILIARPFVALNLLRSNVLIRRGSLRRHAAIAYKFGITKCTHTVKVSRRGYISFRLKLLPVASNQIELIQVRSKEGTGSRQPPSPKNKQFIP